MTGQIINLHGDPHRDVLALLPWHVTGTLDDADTARVEAHLHGCAECREALAVERRLDRAVVREPATVDAGWAVMRQRLDLDAPHAMRAPRHAATTFGRAAPAARWPQWLTGWRLAPPIAFASLAVALLIPATIPARFTALGSAPAPVAGNMVVIFRPETSEAVFRQTLRGSEARLVDGPTAANAYVLQVPAARRTVLLDRLRHQPQIVLAEPVDAVAQP